MSYKLQFVLVCSYVSLRKKYGGLTLYFKVTFTFYLTVNNSSN